MDPVVRNLLVEVARTVLRVLEFPAYTAATATAPATAAAPAPAPAPVPAPATAPAPPVRAERGSTVRVWTGDRYEAGVVESISRDHQQVTVRIKRAEGHRDRLVRTAREKAEVLRRG